MRYLKILTLLLLISSQLSGQYPQGFYMPIGFSYAFETVKDNSLSPGSYSGHLGGLHLGFYYQDSRWLSQLDLSAAGGYQYPDVNREANSSQTTTGIARGSYSLSYCILPKNSWKLFVGLQSINSFDFRSHNRYGNSQDNFTALFSAGPVLTVQKPLDVLNQNFLFQYQLGIPAGTYYFRPSYIRPYLNAAPGDTDFAWWGDYYELSSRADLAWTLDNGNELRLTYHWQYSQLNRLNKVQLGTHYLALTSVFKF